MASRIHIVGLALLGLLTVSPGVARPVPVYPETRRDVVVGTYSGREVPDPYRWLEGDVRRDPAVATWIQQQNTVTRQFLDAIPERATIRQRLERIWNFEKLSTPKVRGEREFFERNSGLQNQSVIFVREGIKERALIDPNKLSASGSVVVRDWKPSPDGSRLLYAVQENGGDRRQLHVVDVATGIEQALPLDGIRTPAFDWAADGSGIYYTRYTTLAGAGSAPTGSAIYFHRLGSPQAEDSKLFADPSDGKLILWPRPTADGRWLIVEFGATDGSRGNISAIELGKPDNVAKPLVTGMKASWRYVGSRDSKIFLVTSDAAPRGRVVALDPAADETQTPLTIAPPTNAAIQQAVMAGDEIIVRSLDGLESRLHRYSVTGSDRGRIKLPPLTVVSMIEGRAGVPAVHYSLSSLVMAPTLYRFDLENGKASIVSKPRSTWNPADYSVRQIKARSSDGTMVPVTIAQRRSGSKGPRPTMVLVYGGWGLSVDVGFYESRFAWMELGGTFAIAHIRGGGEFGEAWHRAAMKEGHLKGIEDFAGSVQTLHRQRITTPAQTIAYGSSNGGMMVAATVNARPDLFGVAIPRVPVTDLLRFPEFTSGETWIGEIGDPSDPKDFAGLMLWSPLHNIKVRKRYPAVLVNTAEGDDRVVPMHSFKYIAALQASQLGGRPKLIRIERDAGHGEGKSIGQLIDEFADLWSFAAHESGLRIR